MAHDISRRDFMNGTALAIGAGLTPWGQLRAETGASVDPSVYPPRRMGLRGSHDGAFEVAHAIRDGKTYSIDGLPAEETYDLVVVGAGIAGLSAAWFYRRNNPGARILILDNHDDFGGHAKRNEFDVNGRLILGYGGSESMVSPRTDYGKPAQRMFRTLRLDADRFYEEGVFHRKLYPGLGLSRGVFFAKEAFGVDKLVTGDPMVLGYDEFAPKSPNSRKIEAFIADCPLSDATKAGIIALQNGTKDFMAGKSKDEKIEELGKISYRDFIEKTCGLPKDAGDYFQGRLNDNFGLGTDIIAAYDAMEGGLPGGKGLKIDDEFESDAEPYVHHFPDGNASIARMIARSLVPGAAPGRDMEDIVTAVFDYAKLDLPENRVRIRLNSTGVVVRNEKKGVAIGYVTGGTLHRVAAKKAIVATYDVIARHIVPELPQAQKDIMAQNVKTPLLYTKVIIRNWESFVTLGVHNIAAPMSYHTTVKLDYPVSLGAYKFPRNPKEPIGLQLVNVPLEPNSGLSARDQCRAGRTRLFTTPFADLEAQVRSDLDRMLGPGGFSSSQDIMAITVNRWSHGYSYYWNSLFEDVDASEKLTEAGCKPAGNIAFANSDTAWDAYAHSAIAEAYRAVEEIDG